MSRKISDAQLNSRQTAYACCGAERAEDALQALVFGDKREFDCKMLSAFWYKWAAGVMRDTIRDTPSPCQCITHDFACQVINLFDPACVECRCGEQWPSCTLEADYTVESAVDASFQPQADPAKFYLIVTDLISWGGTWASNVNDIVTGTTFSLAPDDSLIYAASQQTWWVMIAGAPHEYFPRVQGTLVSTTLTVVSQDPTTNATEGRDVLIQISSDGITWNTTLDGAYMGPESVLASSFDMTVPDDTAFVRITYYRDNEVELCQYGPFLGNIPAQLPQSIHFDSSAYMDDVAAAPYPFNFLDEDTWTMAFWFRSDTVNVYPFIGGSHNPLYVINNNAPQWELELSSLVEAPDYPNPPFFNGFAVRMDDIIGGGNFDVTYTYDYLDGNLYNGQWHHVAIVKTTFNADVPPVMYLDGVNVNMVVHVPAVGARTTDFSPATDFHLGDQSGLDVGFKTVDFYVCSHPCTQQEVQTILMPRLIAGNDTTWGRVSWQQPAATDAIGVAPYISGNQAGAPDLTPHSGGVQFSPDVP
jgi:hypothetical protein